MYGSEILNNHNILRYGLTIEFVKQFSSLKYLGLEIPLTLVRNFHLFIKPFVNKNLSNLNYINKLQRKHKIYTMKDVQKALNRKPKLEKDLSKDLNRNTILMPAALTKLALEQFPNNPTILMVTNHYDETALKGNKLTKNILVYSFSRAIKKTKISNEILLKLKAKLKYILSLVRNHEVFGTTKFKNWFEIYLIRIVKVIYSFDLLIRKQPIGVILDHFEVAYPGNVSSLLALKYNLPFIYVPQLLITDQSFIPTKASLYCVWGKNYKEWMVRRGIDPTKIIITGNLRFEYVKKVKSMSKTEFTTALNIPPNNLIITVTTQQFEEKVNLTIMNWIEKFISASPKSPIIFLIRPHPSDRFDYTPFLKKPKIILSPKNVKLFDILTNTDFVMTLSSTTAIEAALFNKGIIVLQPSIPYHYDYNNNDFHAHLVKAKAGLTVSNEKDLVKHLMNIINGKEFRNSVVKQGQKFLRDTVEITVTPSIVIRNLIKNYIK